MTNDKFIAAIAPIIVQACKSKGYKFPSAIIAQACLESNYGRSQLSSKYHNYFGMKCGSSWKGKSVNFKTKEEYTTGTLTTIRDNFRVYDTMKEGVYGYFDFITMKRYRNLKDATSALDYIERLKNSGWATSSTYIKNVYNTLLSNGLDKYDDKKAPYIDPRTGEEKAPTKTLKEICEEVISGKYGNGKARRDNLEKLGYNYGEIQKEVNKILRG